MSITRTWFAIYLYKGAADIRKKCYTPRTARGHLADKGHLYYRMFFVWFLPVASPVNVGEKEFNIFEYNYNLLSKNKLIEKVFIDISSPQAWLAAFFLSLAGLSQQRGLPWRFAPLSLPTTDSGLIEGASARLLLHEIS